MMRKDKIDSWAKLIQPKQDKLTEYVLGITKTLLNEQNIEYLAISSRTKSIEKILEKIIRKQYNDPANQLTDISGIRIIVYLESSVNKVLTLIRSLFDIDEINSLNKVDILETNQTGYRSVHYVCNLGTQRLSLPECSDFKGLKFEFQVRTVLQHAWAELAHDRKYKFSGRLPRNIERELYLYAGLLEIADKGFDKISSDIDDYINNFINSTLSGDLNIEINSLTLEGFMTEWLNKNDFYDIDKSLLDDDIIDELNQFGINTILDLNTIIPKDYAILCSKHNNITNNTPIGILSDWMIIADCDKYFNNVKIKWGMISTKELDFLALCMNDNDFIKVKNYIKTKNISINDY